MNGFNPHSWRRESLSTSLVFKHSQKKKDTQKGHSIAISEPLLNNERSILKLSQEYDIIPAMSTVAFPSVVIRTLGACHNLTQRSVADPYADSLANLSR